MALLVFYNQLFQQQYDQGNFTNFQEFLNVVKMSGMFIICGVFTFLVFYLWRMLVNKFFKNQFDAIYRFKMILDNSEESVIILSNRKINYVNKKFLNKYQSVIMKFSNLEHEE